MFTTISFLALHVSGLVICQSPLSSFLRTIWDEKLEKGEWGSFREADEVMLYRIIRDSKLPVAQKIPFPRDLRHLHLGDFKESMKVRFKNSQKMRSILDGKCAKQFIDALSNTRFKKIINIVSKDAQIGEILNRAIEYCSERGGNA